MRVSFLDKFWQILEQRSECGNAHVRIFRIFVRHIINVGLLFRARRFAKAFLKR